MEHTIEEAPTGRAKCRGCGEAIPKGSLRLGERLPNPFSDSTPMTLWFHPVCAAFKRPETFAEIVGDGVGLDDEAALLAIARAGSEHRRLPRVDGADRAPTARAKCRACREQIPKGDWRIKLVYFEDGRFNPSGYIHASCAKEYLGTSDILTRLVHFSGELTDEDLSQLESELAK